MERADLFEAMRADFELLEQLLLTPYEPPKCECCGHAMLAGLGPPVHVCRECNHAGAASDPAYCVDCKGEGSIGTGIDEAPRSPCRTCKGTGLAR